MGYVLDNKAQRELERLETLQAVADPSTIRRLETIGVRDGWRCLEVGGGGGSIARWLGERAGPSGSVVATDIETKFLDLIDAPKLEVRRHDIAADPLEEGAFDLVHARAVLEHLSGRDAVLRKMVAALKPGGWLLLEDADFATFLQIRGGNEELYTRVIEGFMSFTAAAGHDGRYARNIGCLLREQGLEDVQFEGEVLEWGGPRPLTKVWLLAFEQLRDRVVEAGLASDAEVDALFALIQDPKFVAMGPIGCAAWGRKVS